MESMARLAHKLKGTAGDICAPALREQALVTELAARSAAPATPAAAFALADALDALMLELQARPAASG
jgi:HPt (histidine-containing phosphotransfer) domain-containing protein